MDAEQQPALAEQLARDAAGRAARHLARQALTKLATLVGAKAGLIVTAVIGVIMAVVLLVVVIVSVAGAAFQSSTAVWPVPVKTDTAGNYQASGWTISSRFGWRDDPQGGGAEFHDGLDLANPNGTCPFGYHCGAPAMFDGRVQYVGWDVAAAAGDPSKTGGGEMVIMQNGQDDHQTIYAHLEPYRLYVQLQGRIEDEYRRYDDYRDYQPIGHGPLWPDLSNGGIEMTCLNDMPNFIPTRSGRGTVVFMYDRPATCTTTVVWGQHGDDWQGWIPDQPSGRDGQRADLRWQTPIDPGQRAQDVALRFRAHLVPPPPPPPITATATLTPEPGVPAPSSLAAHAGLSQPGRGSTMIGQLSVGATTLAATVPAQSGKPRSCAMLAGGWTRCAWSFADIPTERERFDAAPDRWIIAAQTVTRTQTLSLYEEDERTLTLTPAQRMSVMSPALAPIATPTPIPASAHMMPAAMPPGIGGINRQSAHQVDATPTPALSQRGLTATLDPPAITPGAMTTLRIAVTGSASETPAYLIIALPNNGGLRLAPTLPPACFGAAILITCPVQAPSDISIPLELRDARGAPSLDMTVMLMPTRSEPERRQSLQLQVVQDTPTPPSATPALPSAPTTPVPPSSPGSATPDCAAQPLVQLPNVIAPNPRLIAPAAASFAAVRAEILERTGIDALAVLGDVLRQPSFTTSKPDVLQASWHKAGRAVDLNQGGPFVRVAEGNRFRLYVNNVDITTIFEAYGWQRIPVQGDTAEWWHYEWHPDGIAWTSAMRQVWELSTLQAAFPEIAWSTIGCAGGSNSTGGDPTTNPLESEGLCVLGAPSYRSAVETFTGCGPPVRAGDKVYQLDSTLGFVGLTGQTTGPHLHLGLKVKSYDGSWPTFDICTPEWLQGRTPPADANCFTDLADPLAFLPQAPGNTGVSGDAAPTLQQLGNNRNLAGALTPTPIIPEGAPYQLPPPNYPGALVFTPVPGATPIGQYWSPYADGGRYGGGGVGLWFCTNVWSGFPWCN